MTRKKQLNWKKYNHIFISPHLDDAVLSCGGYISSLNKDKEKTLIVTVFNGFGSAKASESGKIFIKQCDYNNARNLFLSREIEEMRAAEILKYDYLFLDYPDAIFRFVKIAFWNKPFYKTVFPKNICFFDKTTFSKVEEELLCVIEKYSAVNGCVYFPLAVGNHVDHRIINKIGKQVAKNINCISKNIAFYEDVPYIMWSNIRNVPKCFPLKRKRIKLDHHSLKQKYKAICAHKSQLLSFSRYRGQGFKKQFWEFYKNPYENYWFIDK